MKHRRSAAVLPRAVGLRPRAGRCGYVLALPSGYESPVRHGAEQPVRRVRTLAIHRRRGVGRIPLGMTQALRWPYRNAWRSLARGPLELSPRAVVRSDALQAVAAENAHRQPTALRQEYFRVLSAARPAPRTESSRITPWLGRWRDRRCA